MKKKRNKIEIEKEALAYLKLKNQLAILKKDEMQKRLELVKLIQKDHGLDSDADDNISIQQEYGLVNIKVTRGQLISFNMSSFLNARVGIGRKKKLKLSDVEKACIEEVTQVNKTKLKRLPDTSVMYDFVTTKPAAPTIAVTVASQ